MTQIVRFISFIIYSTCLYSYDLPISFKYEGSVGYDDNYMRFSELEINSYHNEENTQNDYLGDSKAYDSAIISSALQFKITPEILTSYKTNLIFKGKFNYYSSSQLKSYSSISSRLEIKLAPYTWIKLSYSLLPDYYLRTYIDRDTNPLDYYPCSFNNETIYLSISHNLPLKRTWIDYRLINNNQFYNKYFTEFDSKIYGLELALKSKLIKSYYSQLTFLYYSSKNISYSSSEMLESSKMDRSYIRNGFKWYIKKTFKKYLISSIGLKLYYNHRMYDLESWFYNSDNWKTYSDYDFRIEVSKKITKQINVDMSLRHFLRKVSSSNNDETSWLEGYKNHQRNELWIKFIYNF